MTTKEKNAMECNRRARKEYEKRNYKRQTILFKIEELEAINAYCAENKIPKNTFYRAVCMEAIGKSIGWNGRKNFFGKI